MKKITVTEDNFYNILERLQKICNKYKMFKFYSVFTENMKEEKNTVDDQAQFLESLNKLVELGKKKDGKLEYSDINEQFKEMDLDGDKTEKILDYLEQNGIVAMVPEEEVDDDIILDGDDDDL